MCKTREFLSNRNSMGMEITYWDIHMFLSWAQSTCPLIWQKYGWKNSESKRRFSRS